MITETKGTLRLIRTSQYINGFRKFKVYLDNKRISDIRDGEEIVVPIENGKHDLYISIDWTKSKRIEFEINEEEEVQLLCGSPIRGKKFLIPFLPLIGSFVPKWFLFVKKL
ncbi:hypothetical protein [Falsibacillus pallidus]|uniref:Uncharacterized protein n=1 Tax=Falsibacillus pallidus TaxID=493781 RepID=A0A370G3R1_9BACI|nr:hypothetical protein [Falsibacillus pallidus]RDI37244.1 hypothetical protein DFR59_12234 [Falsibacillus pallidus]